MASLYSTQALLFHLFQRPVSFIVAGFYTAMRLTLGVSRAQGQLLVISGRYLRPLTVGMTPSKEPYTVSAPFGLLATVASASLTSFRFDRPSVPG